MLTNEEIIERYGNHPGKPWYIPGVSPNFIFCDACPWSIDGMACADDDKCEGYEYAYNHIRTYLDVYDRVREIFNATSTPDPAADVPQEEKTDVEILYICDRRACEVCDPNCRVTKDIRHAKHFELMGRTMVEVEQKPPTYL